MSRIELSRFRPREGALLDLASLSSLADEPDRQLSAWLRARWPAVQSLVLDGLELEGELAPAGPPGTRRPDPQSPSVRISPGVAILTDPQGRKLTVEVRDELSAPWPTSAGPAVSGVLVLAPRVEPGTTDGGLAVARDRVDAQLGFVRPEQAEAPHLLPLARSIGNGRDWSTDWARIWQPEHAAVRLLVKRLEALDQSVWKAEPEGAVWDRQVLGRNWVRYQTMASSFLQACRAQLETFPMTTAERVRLLAALRGQLLRSVERAATDLAQVIGPEDGAGPYRAVLEARA